VSLLHSAPHGADHTHIVIFVLRLHGLINSLQRSP
jgi:hypothetical protein